MKNYTNNPYVQQILDKGRDYVPTAAPKQEFPKTIHGRTFETQAEYDEAIAVVNKAIDLYEQKGAGAEEAKHAYIWRAKLVGQWAQTRGILVSLFKAGDMEKDCEKSWALDREFADAPYLLTAIYAAVPGKDKNKAVELGREAVRLEHLTVQRGEKDEFYHGFDITLGKALAARNWKAAKRGDGKSDHDEAREIVMKWKKTIEGKKAKLGPGESLISDDSQGLIDIEEVLDKVN